VVPGTGGSLATTFTVYRVPGASRSGPRTGTARSGAAGGGAAWVTLNGHDVARIPLADRWSSSHLRAPASVVRSGRNELRIRWEPERTGPAPLSVLADRLAQGLGHELTAVYGEVFPCT
jgi:hypothetical protein